MCDKTKENFELPIYQDFASRFGEEGEYGVEDVFFVLGDGAGRRVPVGGAVPSTI